MSVRRSSLRRLPVLLLNLFLLNAMFAYAATETSPLRIKILTAETHAINGGTPVPKDCDLQNFSAYCNESINPTSQSIMLVQDDQGKSYRITCTTDSRWSKCAPLPVGQTFDAYKQKHGITVLFWDSKGKERKQFYELVAAAPAPQSSAAADSRPPAAAPTQKSPAPAPAPPAATPPASSAVPAVAPPAATPPASSAIPAVARPTVSAHVLPEKVRCSFSSTPSRAEVTIDGRYMGNTPSEIGLTTGTHVIVISMSGFAEWKRELTVASDSVVNVTASLQKTQP